MKQSLDQATDEKILDPFIRIDSKSAIGYTQPVETGIDTKESFIKHQAEVIRQKVIDVVEQVNFSSIDNIVTHLSILLYSFRTFDESIEEVKSFYTENNIAFDKTIWQDELEMNSIAYVLKNFGFIDIELLFESSEDELKFLADEILKAYKVFNPWAPSRVYVSDLYKFLSVREGIIEKMNR